MKRLMIGVLLMFYAAQGFTQDDTRDTVTADTVKKGKSITIKIGGSDSKDDEEDKTKASPGFSFQFVAARFDVGLSTYTDNGSFTLTPANSYLERETWKSSNFGFEFFQM